ncbi:YesL family protein [Neobacillus bataviensis]|uniref:YesL family protein n=1 Tax=Neobacillus bataviensis TaxID=220685 RepID=UPI001CBD27DE|nr:YesL family protein [Neobacillus bataviensis]
MEWKGILGLIFRTCEWIMLLAYLNILWILFTLLGAVVFGIFPATAAMFAVIRKWLISKHDVPVLKTFWTYYRGEFLKTNQLGLMFFVTGLILYLDFKIIDFQNEFIHKIFLIVLFLFTSVYAVTFIYIFPVFVQYDLKLLQYVKNAFLIGIANPIRTAMMVVCLITAFFVLRLAPGLLPFFSGSLLSIVMMTFAYQSINKIEHKKSSSAVSNNH